MKKYLILILIFITSCYKFSLPEHTYVVGRLKLNNEWKWFVDNTYTYMYVINLNDKHRLYYQSNDMTWVDAINNLKNKILSEFNL